MSLDSHIEQLKTRHRQLESEIDILNGSPSVDDIKIVELKRKKLHLKDQIEKLSNNAMH